MSEKPFANQSVLNLLLASHIHIQGWKNLVPVCVMHQTCTKHRLEGHEILCTNIIFHDNWYILLLHHVFMAINKIKITCFDLQAMTASRSVEVLHCSLHTWGVVTYSSFKWSVETSKVTLWSDGLVVKSLDFQSRDLVFKTTGWLQGWLSLLSFWVR